MPQKSHLRQRHGSDALRLEQTLLPQDKSRPHSRSFSLNASHPPPSSSSTPPILENGTNPYSFPSSSENTHSNTSDPNATPPKSLSSHFSKNSLYKIATNLTSSDRGFGRGDDGRSAGMRASRSSSFRDARYAGQPTASTPHLSEQHAVSSANNEKNNSFLPSPIWEQLTPSSPTSASLNVGARLPSGASTPSLDAAAIHGHPVASYPPPPPTWRNMPCKDQLAILAASRFVDFFQMASLQTYMVHQLKSFDPSLPNSIISHQAGVLQGSFTASQIITSILWGRAADQPDVGRKLVLMIGLVGTAISMLGVGFSSSYHQAVAWRVLGGAINGTVGAARTMVAETVDKRWHPRAFLLLPAAFNIANVVGPILGGLLVEPLASYPSLFGPGSMFGGTSGVVWMSRYPYALANSLSSILLLIEALLVHFYLRESLKGFHIVDYSRFNPAVFARGILNQVRAFKSRGARMFSETAMLKRGLLSSREEGSIEMDRIALNLDQVMDENEKGQPRPVQRLPFRRIWTSNVLWTLLSIAIFDFHMGAFNNLWTLFLSTARAYVSDGNNEVLHWDYPSQRGASVDGAGRDEIGSGSGPGSLTRRSPFENSHIARSAFKFSGGLAFTPTTIGFAMAIIGFVGVTLQFLLYPWANARFGLMRCFRMSLFLFPIAYFLAPYITLLPSSSPSPEPASGFWVWLGISIVITFQVAARTFALPASIILLNNSSPHPSVLATIHGLGQADSATFRTLGPILSGSWFGTWYERGVVGMSWWFVAAISALGCFASFYVRNGSGHEILLPGEEGKDDSDGLHVVSAGGGAAGAGGGRSFSGGPVMTQTDQYHPQQS